MRYVIVVVVVVIVVVYIFRNFNQYIFTNNERKVLEKLAEKGRAHCKLELGAVRRFTIRLHNDEILSHSVSV